jgi:hypothetical protein
MADEQSSSAVSLALIEEQADNGIRREWVDDRWYFSVIDVVGILTDAPKPRQYWHDMRRRIQDEGFRELSAFCRQLKLQAKDGKRYATDAADTETLLRIIQSIPSPKAESVKRWLAREGTKRLDEVTRPIDAATVSRAVADVVKPAADAPAVLWARYHEQLAALYYRQAAYEERLNIVEARQDRLEDRLESVEEVTRLVPEILERLGPQTLTSEHQATVKAMAGRLHELAGYSFATIYSDLNAAFHVGRYSDIPDAQWAEVAAWIQARITAAGKRRHS